ncbi:type II toxin-antitoxin system RelN family antitoxin [Leptolyngbya sp. AN03gr2]|uniref:type II toxin-antitoxin system RelN family antitoxin n=1 Tax=unclassified Leptolyngbya TaxID=2650499 RepID=UPI003D3193D1
MRAVKVTGHVDEQGQIHLDQPLADVNGRVEVIVLIEDAEPDFGVSKAEILTNFRQAWHEAMTGQTAPVSQIWEGIEHD